jgi:multiple sugar transport system substrate-binding protein
MVGTNKKIRIYSILLIAFMFTLPFFISGCGKTKHKSGMAYLKMSYWDENQKTSIENLVKTFEKNHPDIKVKPELIPWNQYWIKLDAAASAHEAPDVFWMNVYLPKYVRAGVIIPFNKFIKKDHLNLNNYFKTSIKLFTYRGKLYAMPVQTDCITVYYNKGIFNKYHVKYPKNGWTWNDMIKTGLLLKRRIKQAGVKGVYPLAMELDPQPSYFNLIYQEGGRILSPNGRKPEYNTPQVIAAYKKIIYLMHSGIMPSFNILSGTKGSEMFISQKAAMLYMGTWMAKVFDDTSFAKNIGVVVMPKIKNNITMQSGVGYSISANTKYPKAAWKLVKFLSGPEGSKVFAESGSNIPAYKKAKKYYIKSLKHIDANVFYEALKHSVPFPTSPTISTWFSLIRQYEPDIYSGNIPVATAVKEIANQMNIILSRVKN